MKIIALGDIMLRSKENYIFKYVKDELSKADILFGNLETVILKQREYKILNPKEKSFISYSNSASLKNLERTNFSVLNISNNHILDFGEIGLIKTIKNIRSLKDPPILIGTRMIKENNIYNIVNVNEIKIAFLGYSIGQNNQSKFMSINILNENNIKRDIKNVKNKCDIIFLSLHWGVENTYYPSPSQIQLAHRLVEYGADIIIGHHPHVVQGIEEYKGSIIAYSLGNFNFKIFKRDIKKGVKTDYSVILLLSIDKLTKKIGYKIIPVKINKDYQPFILKGKEKKDFFEHINYISKKIQNERINWNFWYEKISQNYLSGNLISFFKRIKKYGHSHLKDLLFWIFLNRFTRKCILGYFRKKIKNLSKQLFMNG